MKKNLIIAASIFLIASLWILSGAFKADQKTKADTPLEEATLPEVRIAEQSAIHHDKILTLRGRTEAHKLVTLRPRITAIVEEIVADKGAIVKAGEIILKLSVDTREKALKKAEADVLQKRIEFKAASQLFKKNYGSETQLALAEAELKKALSELEEAKLNLSYTDLKAPFDGIIDERHINVGDQVTPSTAIMEITNTNPMLVKTQVSERDIHLIKPGVEANVEVLNQTTRTGTVKFVSSIANEQTRTFPIEVEVNNDDYQLRSGVTAQVLIRIKQSLAHRLSPALLSLSDSGKIGIKILDKEDTVLFVPVTILDQEQEGLWVEGLPEKIRLITTGQAFVNKGQKVKALLEDEQ